MPAKTIIQLLIITVLTAQPILDGFKSDSLDGGSGLGDWPD
jgi:hypothetical protein